jgi:hypothetical protein
MSTSCSPSESATTPKVIEVEARRSFPGHAVFRSDLKPTLHDYRMVQFSTTVETGQRADLQCELLTRHGINAKQNNVTLEAMPKGQE